MTDIDVRPTRPDEYRLAADTMARALLFPPATDEQWAERTASWDATVSFSAWRGAECLGHAGYFAFDTVVPGGARLATAGITRVGVQPTARRHGVATRLMRSLADTAAASGVVVASLRASEATIYHRFGYGVAGYSQSVEIDTRRARPVRGAAGGTLRMLPADQILAVTHDIYTRVGMRRPGMITRPDYLTARYFDGAVKRTANEMVVVHTGTDGIDDGYVHYSTKWSNDNDMVGSIGTGQVIEMIAVDDAVELALWRYVLDVDLVAQWKADERPIDDVLPGALHDQRAYVVRDTFDEQWLRLIDADQALSGRTYNAATGSVVIEIVDPWIPANDGRWRISAEGASRDPSAPADLVAPIEAVSAAYLGGHRWWQLVSVGAVAVAEPAAVARADALFHSSPAPFCGSFF